MTRILEYIINQEETVKSFLNKNGFQAKILSQLKRTDDGITVNGNHAFVNYFMKNGDFLVVKIEDEAPSENIIPREIDFEIAFEDEDILVINKPAGLPVHPSQGHFEDTLANGVMHYYKDQEFIFRSINRLDKNTSGLLIIAKNRLSSGVLANDLQENLIKRNYYAVVKGDFPHDFIKIDAPIARAFDSTIERVVDFERGQSAITNVKKIEYKNGFSILEINLETGRTHQIRVHLKHIGFPLVGDFLYNPDYEKISRQALHSRVLEFAHPVTKNKMSFVCDMPLDMSKIFE